MLGILLAVFLTHLCLQSFPGEMLPSLSDVFPFSADKAYHVYAPKAVALAANAKVGDNVMKCKFCEKIFQHRSKLLEHLVTHTDEKPFQCTMCDKKFTRSATLKRHFLVSHRFAGDSVTIVMESSEENQ